MRHKQWHDHKIKSKRVVKCCQAGYSNIVVYLSTLKHFVFKLLWQNRGKSSLIRFMAYSWKLSQRQTLHSQEKIYQMLITSLFLSWSTNVSDSLTNDLVFTKWCQDFSKLMHRFVKDVTLICQNCHIDFSKLLNGFVKIDIWISLLCHMDLSIFLRLQTTNNYIFRRHVPEF